MQLELKDIVLVGLGGLSSGSTTTKEPEPLVQERYQESALDELQVPTEISHVDTHRIEGAFDLISANQATIKDLEEYILNLDDRLGKLEGRRTLSQKEFVVVAPTPRKEISSINDIPVPQKDTSNHILLGIFTGTILGIGAILSWRKACSIFQNWKDNLNSKN